MAERNKKRSFTKTIFNLLKVAPSLFSIFAQLASLINLEASLAKNNLIKMGVAYLLIGCFFLSLWWSVLALLIIFLLSYKLSFLLISFIVLIVNMISILIAFLYFLKMKNNIFFVNTRRVLSNFFN